MPWFAADEDVKQDVGRLQIILRTVATRQKNPVMPEKKGISCSAKAQSVSAVSVTTTTEGLAKSSSLMKGKEATYYNIYKTEMKVRLL